MSGIGISRKVSVRFVRRCINLSLICQINFPTKGRLKRGEKHSGPVHPNSSKGLFLQFFCPGSESLDRDGESIF